MHDPTDRKAYTLTQSENEYNAMDQSHNAITSDEHATTALGKSLLLIRGNQQLYPTYKIFSKLLDKIFPFIPDI